MKDETLSSKIYSVDSKGSPALLEFKDVKDFIQKLKDLTLEGHDLEYPPQRQDFLKKIDKLAGDDLIHSPQDSVIESNLVHSEDTPDDADKNKYQSASRNRVESSGTHGSGIPACTNCGHVKSEHHKGEVYHVVPGAGVRISKCKKFISPGSKPSSDKTDCPNPKEIMKMITKTTDNQNYTNYECGKCHTEQNMELRRHGKNQTSLYCPNCDDLIEPSICKKFKRANSK